MNEQVDRVVAPALGRVGVNLDQRPREGQLVVTSFIAAQPGADDDHQVGAPVDRLRLRRHRERAEIAWVVFRHDRASVGAGHHAELTLGQRRRGCPCTVRTAAEPQHGAFCAARQVGKPIEAGVVGRHHRYERPADGRGHAQSLALHVDRDFEAHRPARRGKRGADRALERTKRSARLPDAEVGLRDGFQHVGLARHVVDPGAIAVHEGPVDRRGDVQHGEPAVSASTCEPAALPAPVPVEVTTTPSEPDTRA